MPGIAGVIPWNLLWSPIDWPDMVVLPGLLVWNYGHHTNESSSKIKIIFDDSKRLYQSILIKFSTCHGSGAAVACVKFCQDPMVESWHALVLRLHGEAHVW